jgi:hypothetical protein
MEWLIRQQPFSGNAFGAVFFEATARALHACMKNARTVSMRAFFYLLERSDSDPSRRFAVFLSGVLESTFLRVAGFHVLALRGFLALLAVLLAAVGLLLLLLFLRTLLLSRLAWLFLLVLLLLLVLLGLLLALLVVLLAHR